MTAQQFIKFLKKDCGENIVGTPLQLERESGADDAYRRVIMLINIYEKEYQHDNCAAC